MRRWQGLQQQLKRVLVRLPHRQRIVERLGHRLLVDPSELHGFYVYYEREYDDFVFEFLQGRLAAYPRALDLGANIGIYTVFLASQVKEVDAFEPEPAVLPRLRANLALNGVKNVRVHETCVGSILGRIAFEPPGRRNAGIGKVSTAMAGCSYPCTTLDEFFGGPLDEPCFIKMDVEGAEWLVLQAAQAISHPNVPVALLIEIHPGEIRDLGGSVTELRLLLENMGYAVQALTPAGLQPLGVEDFRFWWATSQG